MIGEDGDPLPEKTVLKLKGFPDGKAYIGECVYCGRKDTLSDEHTLPYGLYSNAILRKASCEECRIITSKIEEHVLKNNLRTEREFLGFPSRNKKTRTGKVSIIHNEQNIDVKNYLIPQVIIAPSFQYLPRKLFGDALGEQQKGGFRFCQITKNIDPRYSGAIIANKRISPLKWVRVLTKIAYCEYILRIDNAFRSYELGQFIRGTSTPDISDFFGGRDTSETTDHLHNVNFIALQRGDGSHVILSYVRLFSFIDTPSYLIYLGEIAKGEIVPSSLSVMKHWNRNTVWPRYNRQGHIRFKVNVENKAES